MGAFPGGSVNSWADEEDDGWRNLLFASVAVERQRSLPTLNQPDIFQYGHRRGPPNPGELPRRCGGCGHSNPPCRTWTMEHRSIRTRADRGWMSWWERAVSNVSWSISASLKLRFQNGQNFIEYLEKMLKKHILQLHQCILIWRFSMLLEGPEASQSHSHTDRSSTAERWRQPSTGGKVGFEYGRESNLQSSNRRSTTLPLHK